MSRPGRVERQDASCASIRARRGVTALDDMRVRYGLITAGTSVGDGLMTAGASVGA